MACCRICCGCQNCTEGQQGKCCCGGPSGECCQTGEYCCQGVCQPTPCDLGACCDPFFGCYESTQMECWGFWQGPGTTCNPDPCQFPGACCVDGECSAVESEAECTAAGGVYQGAYSSCEDGSCLGGCCGDPICPPQGPPCRPGYFASRCADLGGTACDPTEPDSNPNGVYSCNNNVTQATVEATGHVVGIPGSQTALDLEAQAAMNSTYVVQLDCAGGGTATFAVGNFLVTVTAFAGNFVNASIEVRLASNGQRYCSTNAPAQNFNVIGTTACGWPIYDCVGVSGAAVFGPTSGCGGASASYTVTLS